MSEISLERFTALQGERFVVQADQGLAVFSAELLEVRSLCATSQAGRQAFSLLFKGPASPVLPQRIYRVAHARDAEPMEVFLVPVGADASGVCYEAVFG